ncbi:hypothetical protein QUF72_18925 [Desulfobacterales bacterium HSG2]|nr:hypothetical protein [Desulfobacterales bacterium HSG2]
MINKYVFPLLSVWIIAAYLHLLHCLRMFEMVSSTTIVFVLFIPVILLEFLFSSIFSFGRIKRFSEIELKWLLLFGCRVLFWFAFFNVWVIFVVNTSNDLQWLKWFAPQFYLQFYLVLRGESWITLITLGLWLFLFYIITVRKKKLRLFSAMILPNVLVLLLFAHLYHYGGAGGLFESRITKQEGVEKFFNIRALASHTTRNHPRGIFFDKKENALFAMFGCTYCQDEIQYPTIVRIDMTTGDTHYFLSGNIRQIHWDASSESLFAAPWYQEVFYELSKRDLSTIRTYPNQTEGLLQYWEPMDIVKDVAKPRVYIGNDVEQAVMAYNLDTGRIDKLLNLYKQGFVKWGGPVWNIVQSEKTRKLYFTSGPGETLYEADPDTLTILRHRDFFDVVGTALEIDDEHGILYYQNGCFDKIYEISLDTYEVKRTLKGEGHARRIRLDKKRNCLYVLGYFSGTVFAVDLNTGRRVWTIKVGGLPHGMDLSEDILWINSMAGILRLNLKTIWEKNTHEQS